ncbi:MAG: TraG family conjugative transposon ATPase [Sphingobacterium sp.]
MNSISFEGIFPIMDIQEDCIISKAGDLTVVFSLRLPEIFTLSAAEYESLHQCWVRALHVFTNHTVIHKQDWFEKKKFQGDFFKQSSSFLSSASEQFFHERPFLDHACYVMITKMPSDKKTANSLFSNLIKGSLVPKEILQPNYSTVFLQECAQFGQIMSDSGLVHIERLSGKSLGSQQDQVGLIEKYCTLASSNDQPTLTDINFSGGIQVGDAHCNLFSLADVQDLPDVVGSRITYGPYSTDHSKFSVGFSASLGQLLPCNHIYNQYIFITDAKKTAKRLERKRLRLQSLALYSRENALSRDATNEFLNESLGQNRQAVKAHFNVLVWDTDPVVLEKIKSMVSSAMSSIDAVCKKETIGAPQIYWAGIPGNAGDFPMNETFDTFLEQSTCFFNMETTYESSLSPMGIRLGDRITGKPVMVDLSDEPMKQGICTNRNKFILGPSGSGKSFFTNHMLRAYFQHGAHIVLVDIGHSYKRLCELLGGYYFTFTQKKPISFNPFFIPPTETLDISKKESLKTMLLALWKKEDELFSRSEYVALSNLISSYYAYLEEHKTVFPGFNSFYEFSQQIYWPILQQEKVMKSDFDMHNFLFVLRPYYLGGEYDYLLNATENLDLLHTPFIVFELDNIQQNPILFPIVTIMIMEVFINKLFKLEGVRKMILIEEAWKALMKEGFAHYLKYLFKTIRRYYGEAIVVTQEIDDIISSPIVKETIIYNSDCKILLDQRKFQNKFDQVQQLLGLSDKEKDLVLSVNKANDPQANYKEVFISLGSTLSKVYRVEVSLEEMYTYTTEQTEKILLDAYVKKYDGNLARAISMIAQDTRDGLLKS